MSERDEQRVARLVLVNSAGQPLGCLPALPVDLPYWSEVESVVRAVRERDGIEVTIVRLLEVEGGRHMRGGRVTYLAETGSNVTCAPWNGTLDEQPKRARYAEVGGARADLEWADDVLADRGLARTGAAEQIRTWNLSSLWRLPTADGFAWLKAVPGFFAHEAALVGALAPAAGVPSLLGAEPGRMLMAHIAGEDLYTATLEQRLAMIDLLVDLQAGVVGRVDEFLSLGVPDSRDAALQHEISAVYARLRPALTERVATDLEPFVDSLPARLRALRECGLRDTLVHGDFHPGNLRGGDDSTLILLDWSDARIGNPLLDHSAFMATAPEVWRDTLRNRWIERWREVVPGSDPARAWALLEPVAAAKAAAVYQRFLDEIEPAERRYHEGDPEYWLARAATLVGPATD